MPYRNIGERTRDEYQNDLEDIIQFGEKSGMSHAQQVGSQVVARFIAVLEHKAYSNLTRKRNQL